MGVRKGAGDGHARRPIRQCSPCVEEEGAWHSQLHTPQRGTGEKPEGEETGVTGIGPNLNDLEVGREGGREGRKGLEIWSTGVCSEWKARN